MKIIIIAAALMFAVTGRAQTFVRYAWTNSQPYLSINVPTNTLLKTTFYTDSNQGASYGALASVQFPEFANPVNYTGQNIYGPSVVTILPVSATVAGAGTSMPPDSIICVAEFDPVNITPALTGFAVQPANSSAQIALQTSTDLKTWTASAPGSYGLTNTARFFRLGLTVTP